MLQLGRLDLTSRPAKLMLAMLAAVAELKRDLIVQRTQTRLARAKAEGKIVGRPAKTSPEERIETMKRYEAEESVSALARHCKVSGRPY